MRLIDANELEKQLVRAHLIYENGEESLGYTTLCFGSVIRNTPTVEAEPIRHGHWIAVSSFDAFGGDEEAWIAHGNPTAYHYCSECKNEAYLNEEGKEILSDYCPNCGAHMNGNE